MSQSQPDSTVLKLLQRSLNTCCQQMEADNYDAVRIILHEAADYVDAALGQRWCASPKGDSAQL